MTMTMMIETMIHEVVLTGALDARLGLVGDVLMDTV